MVILGLAIFIVGCESKEVRSEKEVKEKRSREERAERERLEDEPSEAREFLSGIVVKIYGNLPGLESSMITVTGKDASGGGETIKLGEPILGLHVQTANGLYVIQCSGEKVYALASLIKTGSEVGFPTKYHWHGRDDLIYLFDLNNVSQDPWGLVPSFVGMIKILPEKKAE